MEQTIYTIIFYVLLIDSIGANLMSWGGGKEWYHRHFRVFSRYFPAVKGWTTYYLVLVLLMGVMLCNLGVL